MGKRFLIIFGFTVLLSNFINVSAQNISSEEWVQEVDFLVEKIFTVHPDPFRKHTEEEWKKASEKIKEQTPESEEKAVVELYRLLAMAGDGHTEDAGLAPALRWSWLPLYIKRFSDGWYVRSGDYRYKELFGKPVIRINNTSIDEVVNRIRPLVASDNAIGSLDGIGNLMRNAIILEVLGLANRDSVTITVQDNGEQFSMVVPSNRDPWVTDNWIDANSNTNGAEPLYQQFDKDYDFKYLSNEKLLYVWFSGVRDEGDESIAQFSARMLNFLETNDVNRLVLDLSENSGGNNYLIEPLLRGIISSKKINYPGRFYVVTGRDTYSAAMNLAVALEKYTYAIFVGEPPGATPNHFGDTQEFKLQSVDLTIEISELYWQNSDPRDNRPWITPDIPVTLSFTDFMENRDPVLHAILSYQPPQDFAEKFGSTFERWFRPNQLKEELWPPLIE